MEENDIDDKIIKSKMENSLIIEDEIKSIKVKD